MHSNSQRMSRIVTRISFLSSSPADSCSILVLSSVWITTLASAKSLSVTAGACRRGQKNPSCPDTCFSFLFILKKKNPSLGLQGLQIRPTKRWIFMTNIQIWTINLIIFMLLLFWCFSCSGLNPLIFQTPPISKTSSALFQVKCSS